MKKIAILTLGLCLCLGLGLTAGCASSQSGNAAGHAGHQLVQDEKGQWTCSHCGGDYDGPGKCKHSYCGMDLVKKTAK